MNAKTIIAIWDDLKNTAVKNEKLRKVGEGIVITYDPFSETRKIGIMIDIPWDNTMFP